VKSIFSALQLRFSNQTNIADKRTQHLMQQDKLPFFSTPNGDSLLERFVLFTYFIIL
jgi:hypothetical protein